MLATRAFRNRWFPNGLTRESVERAPLLVFSRADDLQRELLRMALGKKLPSLPSHYIPSSSQYYNVIASGVSYGMLPDIQTETLRRARRLIDLAPGMVVAVELYWHRWNIRSQKLDLLSAALEEGAAKHLPRSG